MPGKQVDIGTKTTIAFATSLYSAEVLDLNFTGFTVEKIDTSNFGTVLPTAPDFGAMTSIPSCLVNPGDLTIDVHWNPFLDQLVGQPPELITLTWPLSSGDTTSTIYTFTGYAISQDVAVPLEDKMVSSITIAISGEITVVKAT